MPQLQNDRLLRVAYFSRNAIQLPRADAALEVDRILKTAQTNNAKLGITGVLLFNEGAFAQILEGPAPELEDLFDRIQLDDRHFDITVLETDWTEARLFPNWSMGFAGHHAAAAAQYAGVADRSAFDLEALSANDLVQVVRKIAERNELTLRAS